ncbi:MAG: hypothetical protein IIB58_00345 [Planctomycetes bacterium]|nr:hypothetical protein [Planctomycetota bacterium]
MSRSALRMRLCSSFPKLMVLGACALLAVGAAIIAPAGAADDETRRAGKPASASDDGISSGVAQRAAIASFTQQHPESGLYRSGSRITRVYGQAFGHGDTPEQTAEQFRLQHAEMFGVPAADLRPVSILEDQRHTQQVMFDRQTGEYKFTLVYFSQYVNRIPVFRADLRLLVRNEVDSPLVLASVNLRNLGGFTATLDGVDLKDTPLWEGSATELVPALRNFTQPKPVIWAGVDDMTVQPALAVTFVGDNEGAPKGDRPEKWLFVAHATSGKILYRENQILETDVFGHVGGLASDGPGADICAEEVFKDMPRARVNIGGTNVFADEFGDFVIPNAGNTQVTVQSPVRGQRFRVFNAAGTDTVLSMNVLPPGPADFVHNAANNNELIRAEINAYVEANFIRDLILEANPTYPVISTQTEYTTNVNVASGFCPGNAWYSGSSINFCRAGSGFPNTAWSSVVYHEYGHHLVAMGGSGQGAYGEGMGDVLSTVGLDDSRLGFGFFGDCVSWLRDADNDLQYPCSGGIHFCGQLLSGCVWSTRNELIVTEPVDYLEILRSLSVNAVLLHSGPGIAPDITIDWLTLDDDDANIGNGTPHYIEIDAGFSDHSMPAPPLNLISFEYPNGLPDQLVPNVPTVIRVDVVPVAGTPMEGSGTVSYSVDGGPFTTVAMDEINPNEYEATLPGVDCPQIVEFYFAATAVGGLPATDPPDAPGTTFSAIAITGTTTIVDDEFETDQGWTVGAPGDDATTGIWTRVDPNGTAAQPENDHTPAPATMCFVTGQGSPGGPLGANDVDDGRTTLLSPTFDASSAVTRVSYWRWYSNDTGAEPNADVFQVDISNNNGTTWTNVETVGPAGSESNGGWFFHEFQVDDIITPTSTMKMRFVASDEAGGSLVEAAVDDFLVDGLECGDFETVLPDTLTIVRGQQNEGDLEDLFTSDNFYVVVQPSALAPQPGPPVQVEVEGTAPLDDPSELRFRYEGHVTVSPVELEILMFNFDTQEYDSVDVRIAATSDEVVNIVISDDPGRYIEAGTGKTRTLMRFISLSFEQYLFAVARLDQTTWTVSP